MSKPAKFKMSSSTPKIGIGENARREIVARLSEILAESYMLTLQTQNVHWNVRGPQFKEIHDLTDGQYTEMAAAIDLIAERIRALGSLTPASFDEFREISKMDLVIDPGASASAMLSALAKGHESIINTLNQAGEMAGENGDLATQDLCVQRLHAHSKYLWMITAILEK